MIDDKTYLEHILDAIDKVDAYTADGRDAFMADTKTQDAVVRNFEIIGEATKRLTSELRENNPDIPWKEAAAFRDVLSHDYMGIDLTIVWNVVESHLPELRESMKAVLSKLA
ncbi:MAG: DUF86 domain-containing protein [bacterium]|nr:DUF86 domain-containing protein [bacterium]